MRDLLLIIEDLLKLKILKIDLKNIVIKYFIKEEVRNMQLKTKKSQIFVG